MHKALHDLSKDIVKCERIVSYCRTFGYKRAQEMFGLSRHAVKYIEDHIHEWKEFRKQEEQEQNN